MILPKSGTEPASKRSKSLWKPGRSMIARYMNIFLILIICSTPLCSVAGKLADCVSVFSDDFTRESWSPKYFTDPNFHSPDQFRYFIHGVQILKNILDLDPSFLGKNEIISASIIDQNHRKAFAPLGLIIGVPETNVIAAAPHDIGSPKARTAKEVTSIIIQEVNRLIVNHPVRPLNEVLIATPMDGYNEILVTGSTGKGPGREIAVVGVYIVPIEGFTLAQMAKSPSIQAFLNWAHKWKLPVVEITPRP